MAGLTHLVQFSCLQVRPPQNAQCILVFSSKSTATNFDFYINAIMIRFEFKGKFNVEMFKKNFEKNI